MTGECRSTSSARGQHQRRRIGVQSDIGTRNPDQQQSHQRLATVFEPSEAGSGALWFELYTENSCGSPTRVTALAIALSMQAFLCALDARSPWDKYEHTWSAAKLMRL